MKPIAKKEEFIILRSEGYSLSNTAKKIGIGKSTAHKWDKELIDNIRAAKNERLQAAFTMYRIGKAYYIEKLGEILKRIDKELADRPFDDIPTEKLLKIKLEYESKLQSEYINISDAAEEYTETNINDITTAAADLYNRVKNGSITGEQARREGTALDGLRRAVNDSLNNW